MHQSELERLLKQVDTKVSMKVDGKWTTIVSVGPNKFGSVSFSVNWEALDKARASSQSWSNFSVFFNEPRDVSQGNQAEPQPQTNSIADELNDEVPF